MSYGTKDYVYTRATWKLRSPLYLRVQNLPTARISMPVIELANDVRGVQGFKRFQPGIAVLLPEQIKILIEFIRPC